MTRRSSPKNGQIGRLGIPDVCTEFRGKESPNASCYRGLDEWELRIHGTGRRDRDHGILA